MNVVALGENLLASANAHQMGADEFFPIRVGMSQQGNQQQNGKDDPVAKPSDCEVLTQRESLPG
jgi:hypothetical protein